MKIDTFFKKAFYINLDDRPDRKEQFEREVGQYGLTDFIERYSACVPKIDDVGNDFELLGYRRLGGCGRSHLNVVRYAKDNNLDNILIFEDDATFYNGGDVSAIAIIENSLDTLSRTPDWDVYYMGGIIRDELIYKPFGNLIKVDKILTTHAWAINSKCYDRILSYRPGDGYTEDFDSPIDGYIGNNMGLNKYLAYPLAVYQRENVLSDCAHNGNEFVITGNVEPWLSNYNKDIRE